MKRNELNDRFKVFPYRAERRDDDTNNGGLDLINNPADIEKIHEAASFPALKAFISMMNSPTSALMTLGCAHGEIDGLIYGYVDISFRDVEVGQNEGFVSCVDELLKTWVKQAYPHGKELAEWLRPTLHWDYSEFRYFGTEPRLMISMTYRTRALADANHLFGVLHCFFEEGLTLPGASDL
ncbi:MULTISPECIES: hypothetical protein [unclassified Pandoraea]|uniref:hypothetical protein n=1 Tax=unclassified Pandoraea TaxID=2624094 RepID=UPI00036E0DD6|nr:MULTISPECIES: hypothetical protein [unclassified Pandoraea]